MATMNSKDARQVALAKGLQDATAQYQSGKEELWPLGNALAKGGVGWLKSSS